MLRYVPKSKIRFSETGFLHPRTKYKLTVGIAFVVLRRHTSYVRYEIGREMPKPRRLSVFHPSPPVPMATNGQTNARYFIELVCLSSNLMEFASEFVFLSVVAPVRPFLTDRRTEYISLNLSVCRIT